MLSTLKCQCNCQVQWFCVTQICLYMLSAINKHPCSLFSTRQHVCHSVLYAIAHQSVRLSVCLSHGWMYRCCVLTYVLAGLSVSDNWQIWTDFNNSASVHNNFQMNCKLILDNVLSVHADSPLLHTVSCEISLWLYTFVVNIDIVTTSVHLHVCQSYHRKSASLTMYVIGTF